MSLDSLGPEQLMAIALRRIRVKAYVDERLEKIRLTQQEACQKSGVPEAMLERFLDNFCLLEHGELLRVIIMFGSVLGDPEEFAMICGLYEPENKSNLN